MYLYRAIYTSSFFFFQFVIFINILIASILDLNVQHKLKHTWRRARKIASPTSRAVLGVTRY